MIFALNLEGEKMKFIKKYWQQFKKTKVYIWYKSLPISVVGLTTFLTILGFLTAIFNWFWTGTGSDPKRTFYASFTNNFEEFQEYATLYITLLGFGATMFAGLAVFLVFNDWKEQHNAKLCSDIAQRIWNKLDLVSSLIYEPSRKFNRLWELSSEDFNNLKPYMLNIMSQLEHTVIEVKSDLKLLGDLLDKDISSNLESNFKNFTYDTLQESIDIFQKLQDQYYNEYYSYQKEIKELLIPIIKA